MNYIHTLEEKQRLLLRDESKLKFFDCSLDLRSWSHDHERKSRYLREWMKSDMPIRVFSGQKFAVFLNNMTCKSRRKLAPRCHPDCKSKLVLDSICNSCDAMQECLKKDNHFNSLYQEEEFETCYWPCERCLGVLKDIKVFWKAILEKIFNFNVPKTGEFGDTSHKVYRSDTVHSVAKVWEKELIQQVMFVNKIMPMLKKNSQSKTLATNVSSSTKQNQTVGDFIVLHKSSPQSSLVRKAPLRKRINRGTTVKIKMVDNQTNTSDTENDQIELYKYNIQYLQKQFNQQENEILALKKENNSLKLELENFYDNISWKTPYTTIVRTKADTTAEIVDSNTVLPKPFESCADDKNIENLSLGIDSEVIITMRDCANENFKHVSLLQVLHKTNEPIGILSDIKDPCHTKQNPVELLERVRNAFGELVEREINVAMRSENKSQSKITASFFKVNISKSEPSCSTIDLTKISISNSDQHFYSL